MRVHDLHGEKLGDNNKRVPPDLAELVFEVQEQLAELRRESSGSETFRAAASEITQKRKAVDKITSVSLECIDRIDITMGNDRDTYKCHD